MRSIYSFYHKYPRNINASQYNPTNIYQAGTGYQNPNFVNTPLYNTEFGNMELKDYGPQPFVINIDKATKQNENYRTALWTGSYLQLTLMSIPVGGEIGLEIHPDHDQFIRIEEGQGLVKMGDKEDYLDFEERVYNDFVFIIPAGTWHNLINTGNEPIKLYSIYAPPQHPWGTVHPTKEDAEASEQYHANDVQSAQNTLPDNNLYGAKAAKADVDLTLEDMLIYAIQDEYLLRARYFLAIEKFGEKHPFINIISSEENHISYLMTLFIKYEIVLPTDNAMDYVLEPENIKEGLEAGVEGEIENITMYEKFLEQNIPNDVKAVFTLLRNASKNHLWAFQRALSFY